MASWRSYLGLGGLALLVAACAQENRHSFDGQFFRAGISVDRDDRRNFVVSVAQPERSYAGAREAARHRGVTHCIERFGNSYIDWQVDPDVEDVALLLSGGQMVLQGRCRGW